MPSRNPTLPKVSQPSTSTGLQSELLTQAVTAIRETHTASDPCDVLASLFRATRSFGVHESAYVHVIPDPEQPTRVLVTLACDPPQAYKHGQFGHPLGHPWLRYARD